MRTFGWTGAIVMLATTIASTTPTPAQACGGTFCDAGPNVMDPEAMPVDQTGETIVFLVEDDHVEAHIQINYDPDSGAERFAWLIPIMGENPEFSVGSQRLFLNLQNSTVPSYGYVNQRESCGGGGFGGDDGDWGDWGGDGWEGDGCDSGAGGAFGTSSAGGDGGFTGSPGSTGDAGAGEGGDDGNTTGGGTEVVSQSTVGAFDIAVIESETAEDLMTWLGNNEFFEDPIAEPILQQYVEEGAKFAAIRLSNTADVGEIHPITMRYEGGEPCVPIRLTRIAAEEDMDIRAFFLAGGRTYPTNYKHVELNKLMLDWIGLADNYKDVVTLAIDTPLVNGHGFVTEYAGSTDIVPRDGLFDPSWDYTTFQNADAIEVIDLLQTQGLANCDGSGPCVYGHPLVESLLVDYLPVPEGMLAEEFYNCLPCYEELIDQEAWDGTNFARDFQLRIIEPGRHAMEMLDDKRFVTRLYTTISPHEMTIDPMFHTEPHDVTMVNDTDVTANRYFACNGSSIMQDLPEARDVNLPNFDIWPEIAAEMPYAEKVMEMVEGAAPVVLIDNTELIEEQLESWNGFRSAPAPTTTPRSSGFQPRCFQDEGLLGGCGCRSDQRGNRMNWGLLALALGVGSWSRRRRRRR